MDFDFSEEQQMLLESTRRFLAERYSFEHRQRAVASPSGYSREVWAQFADLGLLGLNLPAEHGGIDAGAEGTLAVSLALGEALAVEPYLSSAVLATHAIAQLGSPAQRANLLPRLAAGEMVCALAHEEAAARCADAPLGTVASLRAGEWSLTGSKSAVYHAPLADLLLVSALVGESAQAEWGLFAIPRESPGLILQSFITVDGQRAADLTLTEVVVPQSARIGADVAAALPKILDFGVVALCAEALGAMEKLLSLTLEYSRTRVQFGVPIGQFQALRHRMADMLTHVEQARSMAYLAGSRCALDDRAERERNMSAAKVIVGQAARFVGQQAVQVHGGMGVSDEFCVSHYFKRLLACELRFGSTSEHLERYASRLPDCSAAPAGDS